jgi:large subunit ribosomal protein L21
MYAVIRTGGKQYRVQENDTILIEKLEGAEGDTVTLGEVLCVGGTGEESPRFGAPLVSGASVSGTIVRQGKGKKIHGITYIKVKNHQRHYGHRQLITTVKINTIDL